MKHTSFFLAAASLLTAPLCADNVSEEHEEAEAAHKEIGLFFNADLLYWQMHEEGLEFAATGIKGTSNANPDSVKRGKTYKPDFKWEPGFRVGAGYIIPHRNWDISLDWTRYDTEKKKSVSHSGELSLNPLYAILDQPRFMLGELLSSSAKLKFHYDTLDLELGRRWEILPRLTLRPEISLRGALINQDYKIDYLYSNGAGSVAHEQYFKNDFLGLGLRAGLDSLWAITPHFGLFGNIAASLVGGRFHVKEKFNETLNTILPPRRGVFVNMSDKFYDVVPEVELAFGLHLAPGSSKNRYRLEIDIGWEYLVWFNQNQMYLFTSTDIPSSAVGLRERGNMSLQGLIVNATLHF